MVIPYQTDRLHRYWLTWVAKDANAVKMLSADRLVHYMLGLQLNIKKKHELWSRAPQPVRFSLLEFENLTGLNCEYIENLERPNCVVTSELASFGRSWELISAGPSTGR
ncbi:hypothetical protein Bca52824_011412 [Brassica carinata]|uniref:DUF1985 domain-containing protein n=1 Tax=Brassica carinata TaxID=52824 RepID=A0A8X7WFB1_BRACI|nr:hypothetical protein Bca52824_011412 [Brassica carinata]